MKVVNLQFKIRKVKSENKDLIKGWQETTEGFEVIEKGLKLQIENGENQRKQLIAKHITLEKLKENVECPVCMEIPRAGPMFVCPNGHFV